MSDNVEKRFETDIYIYIYIYIYIISLPHFPVYLIFVPPVSLLNALKHYDHTCYESARKQKTTE